LVVTTPEPRAGESVSFHNTVADQALAQLIKACDVGDIASNPANVIEVQGKRIALFNVGGTFHALDNACPHRGGQLGKGSLDGNVVTCPSHHWKFDVTTGVCVSQWGVKAKSYSVSIQGGAVMLALVSDAVAHSEGTDGRRYLVRFGTHGYMGWFVGREPVDCGFRERVVVRTSRGLEAGEILNPEWQATPGADDGAIAGELLRRMTEEDKLQEQASREGEARAFDACRQLLAERKMPVELIDVEQLLDGENIIFHFLGDPPSEMADLTQELAGQYDARVEFRQFMERVEAGCGPGCGTDEAPGCGSCGDEDGCSSCGEDGGCAIAKPPRKQKSERT
jgi:nitrite reductase/ring-hydroxylating ferredoxin subunit